MHDDHVFSESAPRSSIALPARTVLNGNYELGRVLGKGGFGITYAGLDNQLQMPVAIKEYLPTQVAGRSTDRQTVEPHGDKDADLFERGLEAFLAEGRTLARFNHPHIVRVLAFFKERGTGYLVMPFYAGKTFSERIKDELGSMTPEDALEIMMPVLDGLQAVHEEGFLHRDVKPQNIYLLDDGGIILIDFGAARISFGQESQSLSAVLTPGYAPFEQYYRKGNQGPWTDVYAAAATLYKAIAGTSPPESPERNEVDHLKPAHELNPAVEPALSAVLTKGLAPRPEDRYQTIEAFADALRGAQDGTLDAATVLAESEPDDDATVLADEAAALEDATLLADDATVVDPTPPPPVAPTIPPPPAAPPSGPPPSGPASAPHTAPAATTPSGTAPADSGSMFGAAAAARPPVPGAPAAARPAAPAKKSNTGLIIGAVAGGVLALVILIVALAGGGSDPTLISSNSFTEGDGTVVRVETFREDDGSSLVRTTRTPPGGRAVTSEQSFPAGVTPPASGPGAATGPGVATGPGQTTPPPPGGGTDPKLDTQGPTFGQRPDQSQPPPQTNVGQAVPFSSGNPFSTQGVLQPGDTQLTSGEYVDYYTFQATAGDAIYVEMASNTFDTYLILQAPDGQQVDNDDYEGNTSISVIEAIAPVTGVYRVGATTYAPNMQGSYQLDLLKLE